ncbi:hypothetical protein [uncultured Jatrophihabitans sp.]|uniref:hypothetical protein n=1 Tax=uncultured Jatrophihabitans sp. TaxID=1610747 RepID=UPI0035CC3A89
MDETTRQQLGEVRGGTGSAPVLAATWRALLAHDPDVGVAAAFDLLAGEPRVKPSRSLVVDPGDAARRRWELRVAAAVALLGAPVVARVFDELRDELAADPHLAAEALAGVAPNRALDAQQQAALAALAQPG